MEKGKLFVIDGTDGSGKQTQLQKLKERFDKEGIEYRTVSFPNYDSPSSSLVKMYLAGDFGTDAQSISPYIASTFYAADRYATFKTGYQEYYDNGGIILADRYTTANMVHQAGKIKDKKCVLARCGVGKVHAARLTQIMIDNFKLDCIINVGTGGAINPRLKIGDLIVGRTVVQHDFDITAFGHTKGYITDIGDRIYSNHNLVEDFKKIIKNTEDRIYKIETGTIASGDIFCTESHMKNKIYAKFDAKCVEMEGAAIAQVCYLEEIPFAIIRSISDTANSDNNAMEYEQFEELASRRCANILKEYMQKGFALDDDRLKRLGGGNYFDELLARIRDIRSSEKVFWRKVLEIYATSIDYDPRAESSKNCIGRHTSIQLQK